MEHGIRSVFAHTNVSTVVTHTFHPKSGVGRSLTYKVIFLEASVEKTLTFGKGNRLRFVGELEGIPMQGAFQSAPRKGHDVMLSATLLKAADLGLGSEATLVFNPVPDDYVVVPEDLRRALEQRRSVSARWKKLSASAQRAWVAQVEASKTHATRQARIEKIRAELSESGTPLRAKQSKR
jgi:hypothetical protein